MEIKPEEIKELLDSIPMQDMTPEMISELSHRLSVTILQAAMEGVIPAKNMEVTQMSPMAIGAYLANQVKDLLAKKIK